MHSKGLVNSSQTGIHPGLDNTVQKHLASDWAQPLHRPTVSAYRRLRTECMLSRGQPFILDSGCGTGQSTRYLANIYPELPVIGVDQSEVRLAKSGLTNGFARRGNWILVRAELATFWRLLLSDGLIPATHFLLYPNPWPKPDHLKRRWHGHPVFPVLLSLGGDIEMRCNWELYAREFAHAACLASGSPIEVIPYLANATGGDGSTSPFENKYLQRRHKLFSVKVPDSVASDFRRSRSGIPTQF
jgi:tRNA G46 methylase TrmB